MGRNQSVWVYLMVISVNKCSSWGGSFLDFFIRQPSLCPQVTFCLFESCNFFWLRSSFTRLLLCFFFNPMKWVTVASIQVIFVLLILWIYIWDCIEKWLVGKQKSKKNKRETHGACSKEKKLVSSLSIPYERFIQVSPLCLIVEIVFTWSLASN